MVHGGVRGRVQGQPDKHPAPKPIDWEHLLRSGERQVLGGQANGVQCKSLTGVLRTHCWICLRFCGQFFWRQRETTASRLIIWCVCMQVVACCWFVPSVICCSCTCPEASNLASHDHITLRCPATPHISLYIMLASIECSVHHINNVHGMHSLTLIGHHSPANTQQPNMLHLSCCRCGMWRVAWTQTPHSWTT